MSDQAFMELIPLTPFRKRFVDAGGRPLARSPFIGWTTALPAIRWLGCWSKGLWRPGNF